MAAQRERVFLARGLQADAPDADQRFELVGQRHHGTGGGAGQRIAGKARLVVFGAGQRHIVGFAVMACIVRAHRALQLGELAHHVGQQIGLGQQRAARGVRHIRAELLSQLAGDGLQARHTLKLRADLVVIDHAREQRHAVGQRLFLVLLEEEAGVGQARADHALIALNDGLGCIRGDVRDDQEAVAQMALRVGQRKVLLIGLHGQDQTLLRHGEERFLEMAGVDHGPFDQRVHLIEQRFGHNDRIGAGGLEQFGADGLLALAIAGDDLALRLQRARIRRGVLDDDFASRQETVAQRHVARLQAERADGDDLAVEQRNQLVGGAHELDVLAIRALIRHHLRDRKVGDGLRQCSLQAVSQQGAACGVAIKQRFGLAVGRAFQRFGGDGLHAHGLGQCGQLLDQRRCGLALGIEGDGHGQHLLAQLAIGRSAAHAGDRCGQAARRGKSFYGGALFEQALRRQTVKQAACKRLAEAGQRLGRQFFGQQFDQEGGHSV